jgi:GNAT superfamily N-acetyltransferase
MKADMLVKLYNLPSAIDFRALMRCGIEIKRPIAPDKSKVVAFAGTFGETWACECEAAFSNSPVTCYIAVKDKKVIGFACYDTTAPDYFGPTGVGEEYRGEGIGTALLLKCLYSMEQKGYAYAIIGCVDEAGGFYEKQVGAISIPDSYPGLYKRMVDK